MSLTTAITPKNKSGSKISKSSSSRDSGMVTTVMPAAARPAIASNFGFSKSTEYKPQAMAGENSK